jgi:hypothetical protein
MHQRSDQRAKESRLRRLKGVAVTATASMGMLIWGAVNATIPAADPASTSTPDPVTQDTTNDSSFFSAQNPAPGLNQTANAPMTRTRGS